MNLEKKEIECNKHGNTWALPVVGGEVKIVTHEGEADNYICSRCLAESMVSPIRRAA